MTKDIARLFGAVGTLHLLGWGLFALALASTQDATTTSLTIGAGITAYGLGMRHAFDADHIAAIDNTTRHLRQQDKSPLSVGFWFSLGHSSVVLVACLLLAAGWQTLASQITGDTQGSIAIFTGLWGPTISGLFLIALGTINALILHDLLAARHNPDAAEDLLVNRGLMNRIFGDRISLVTRPRHMYTVGLLFGLGFDTATSVGLLLLGAGIGVGALPWYVFLALPLIFSAGMTLFDSLDGMAMNYAYGWADKNHSRRMGYNIVVTGVSVLAAFVIAAVNLSGVAAQHGLTWLGVIAAVNLDLLGFGLVGFFLTVWGVALLTHRASRTT